jgi:hypothetical protein
MKWRFPLHPGARPSSFAAELTPRRRSRAAIIGPRESKLVELNLLMLKSESLPSTRKCWSVRAGSLALCLVTTVLTLLASASAQDFTLAFVPPGFSPYAVDPGGTSSASLTISPVGGFNGTVDLTCQVTPLPVNYSSSDCQVTPQSVAPPAEPAVTVTTSGWGAGIYTITITGTFGDFSTSAAQNLSVLQVSPSFTLTVTQAVDPSSVHAGSGGQGSISIDPANGYVIPSGGITLSCASVTPLVTAPPTCSFSPNPVTPTTPGLASTLTINTTGPTSPTGAVAHATPWYALWLPLPVLALAGLGAVGGKRSRRGWCLLAVLIVGGAILLIPACSHTPAGLIQNPSYLVTPNNTYTFTLIGVDSNGVASSNTGTASGAPTVTLTVD